MQGAASKDVEGEEDDFLAIPHSGGKVTFCVRGEPESRTFSVQWVNGNPWGFRLFALDVLLPSGQILGLSNLEWRPDKSRSGTVSDHELILQVFMGSDREEMFGRSCPSCRKYFRTDCVSQKTVCPYCCLSNRTECFLTEEQLSYINNYIATFCESINTGRSIIIDIDAMMRESQDAARIRTYSEVSQQTRFSCDACRTRTDIFGRYGSCAACGRRNTLKIAEIELRVLEARIEKAPPPEHRHLREREWQEIIRSVVSGFEAFGKDLQASLLVFPITPARKALVKGVKFNHPIEAARILDQVYGIDIFKGFSLDDRKFINNRFSRRHIYEHNGGVVDENFIKQTEENVEIGRLLRERSQHVRRFLNLTLQMMRNFFEDFCSIQ